MNKKIIFMGTPIFAAKILNNLLDNKYNIELVVSQPDRKVGRKRELKATPVKEVALAHNIPVFQPENIKDDFKQIIDLKPDLIITAAYGQFIPNEVLKAPSIECINVHGSLLPKYRGGAPIHYAVLNGDKKTGVTIMKMISKMDAGEIIAQSEFPINENDTTSIVHNNMIDVANKLLINILPDILNNEYTLTKQDEKLVSYSPNISREQERINWNNKARDVHNHIRGLSEFPGSYTQIDNVRYKIYLSQLIEEKNDGSPGTISKIDDTKFYVNCIDYKIAILEIQPAGKSKMKAKDFVQGVDKMKFIRNKFE